MSKLRLIVMGMMGRSPFGGQTWLYLNWLRGLSALGHDVWYVEDDTVWPYDPIKNSPTDDCEYTWRHLKGVMERVGLPMRWAFRLAQGRVCSWGMAWDQLDELYKTCDALLNIVGATRLRPSQLHAKYRVYIETDPVTSELRLDQDDEPTIRAFNEHHAFVTYGENYGRPDCGVPIDKVKQIFGKIHTTRQPIDTTLWPMAFDENAKYFTTIGNYRQEGSDVEWRGQTYRWSKHHEWEKFINLPTRTSQPFELAMNFETEAERVRFEELGWKVCSPFKMSLDIFGAYPQYFRTSRAQFTVAKDQNIRLRSGWSSERDVCYLASGKPVITQETGFSNVLPTGNGLFAINTVDEALAAIDRINSDYKKQCEIAREIAVEYFDATKVAAKLLSDLGMA